jgi:predicted protein tyrosine phosphatase
MRKICYAVAAKVVSIVKGMPMKFDWIEEGVLAASPLPQNAEDMRTLAAGGIRAIVTLTEKPLTAQRGVTAGLLAELDIRPLHMAIDDLHAPNEEQVAEVVAFIDQMQAEGRPVLIHCKVGQGRTGTLLHGYYLSKGWSLAETRERVAQRRPLCDFTNLSDVQQSFLHEFANSDRVVYT